jgi:hypothetical protein
MTMQISTAEAHEDEILIRRANGPQLQDPPESGALLHVSFSDHDSSFSVWYPSSDAARLAMRALARHEGVPLSADGMSAFRTRPRYAQEYAWVEPWHPDCDGACLWRHRSTAGSLDERCERTAALEEHV